MAREPRKIDTEKFVAAYAKKHDLSHKAASDRLISIAASRLGALERYAETHPVKKAPAKQPRKKAAHKVKKAA